jgi:transposase-like protein
MTRYRTCPRCDGTILVKNGKTNPDKLGRRKQKFLCTTCGKQFVDRYEPLTRTEKRLYSLLYNLIMYKAKEDDSLKTIAKACNKEISSVGKLTLKLSPKNKLDINSLKNVKLVVCADEDGLKIIKTYPKATILTLKELAGLQQKYWDEF